MFTPKFGKEHENSELLRLYHPIRCELISTSFYAVSESAILWMTSVDNVNGLYLDCARKMCQTLQIRKIRVQVIIKLGSFLLFQEL